MHMKHLSSLSVSPVRAGVFGGLIDIISSGAENIKKYQKGEINAAGAGIAVGKDAIGTGVATGFATAAAGTVGGSSLLLMGGTALAVGIAVKYLWNAGVEKSIGSIKTLSRPDNR